MFVIDISDPYDPFVAGKHQFSGYSIYEEDRFIEPTGTGKLMLFDPYEGLVMIDPSPGLAIIGQAPIAGGIEYQLSWTVERAVPQPRVECAVVSGSCTVTGVDHGSRTATVQWLPGDYSGEFAIVFGVGNNNSYGATRARLRWDGLLGEDPEPRQIEVDRFYGVLSDFGLYGSIQHHDPAIISASIYRYEVVSGSFPPQVQMFDRDPSRFFSRFARTTDGDADAGAFANLLSADLDYSLSIGSEPLDTFSAGPGRNINFEPELLFGDGLYEIRGYRILEPIEFEPDNPGDPPS